MAHHLAQRGTRLVVFAWLLGIAACRGAPPPEPADGPFVFALGSDASTGQPLVTVTGWTSAELAALEAAALTPDAWSQFIRLHVEGASDIAVASTYRVTDNAVQLVPRFGMDPGRAYIVSIEASRLPLPRPTTAAGVVSARLVMPSGPASTPTRVTAIYPSATVWPENILRFYLHFSAAMSSESAVGRVQLVDEHGVEIADALLDIDVDLWDTTYRRRTVFFDPGRVKQGIRPNRELGRALQAGRRYAIVVSPEWNDAHGVALEAAFRHEFLAGPPADLALDPAQWSINAPTAGTREPLSVRFPGPLDEGLLHRAVGVTSELGTAIDGHIAVGPEETSWTFTPEQPWTRGPHTLVVLSLLEDPSGNKVGQPFEFEMFERPMITPPERISLPFRPR